MPGELMIPSPVGRALAWAAAGGILGLCLGAFVADAQSLANFMAGRRWAVGGAGNCGVPANSYVLAVSGGTMTWQNGAGHVDVERIVGTSPGYLGTVTVSSYHPGGRNVPAGTRWNYQSLRGSLVGVSSTSGGSFTLAPC